MNARNVRVPRDVSWHLMLRDDFVPGSLTVVRHPELHAPVLASGFVPFHTFRGSFLPRGNLYCGPPLNYIGRRVTVGVV